MSKLNCEVLYDELAFEVRWAIAGDSIVLQLVAKLEDGEYMSFGISGHPEKSQMVGGDVAVAWVNKTTLKGYSEDYYLDAKSQCAGVHGSCPDETFAENTNSIRQLNAALVNGYSIVTYQRPLRAADHLDLPVLTNASQPIIWAIGPLNSKSQVSYHHHFTKGDKFIEFGRPPLWNCPMPEGEEEHAPEPFRKPDPSPHRENTSAIKPNPVPTPKPTPKVEPWEIPAIQCYEPPDGVFYAQMGPTGGKQGYSAITGHVGWGISWYINGLLIPEINVVRGKKYTFVVEGGTDPEVPAQYHPFYITNDPVGGYFHKTDEEKKGVEIYAGVRRARNGDLTPIGVGRLCNWTPDNEGPEADEYPSFGAYQRSLTLVCEEGNPGVVTWIPDKNTPDTVYYQCYTHRYLGWKINVLDECDLTEAEESRVSESVVLPGDLLGEESIQVESRIKPVSNFLDQRKKVEKIINTKQNYNDFSNSKGESSPSGAVYAENIKSQYQNGHEYELPISQGQITKVIATIESLEQQMKDEMKKNETQPQQYPMYQVYEDVKESFTPEQGIRDGDEYIVDSGKLPDNFLFPPNQKPQTLQTVLRPYTPNKPMGNMRPQFRRPVPPGIKLRRPIPVYKVNNGYPLSMPNLHAPHGMSKKPGKYNNNNRMPPGVNRPVQPNIPPMKAMPPIHQHKPHFDSGLMKHVSQSQNNQGPHAMGKPGYNGPPPSQRQTLNLGQTDIIANQVVKSQIVLPEVSDTAAQSTVSQTFFSKPGQIILGKPIDHPQSMDQQMTQTKLFSSKITSTPLPVHPGISNINNSPQEKPSGNEIKSSSLIGVSTDPAIITPALNTGFKPDSIVIESGFKPIIREPLMASEDKITDFGNGNSNRREDTDVEEDYEEAPQYINSNHAYPSDKITETFEPMFIPSPPDRLLSTNDRTQEIFPSNHAKEDRPHPVYVKTEAELNALFGKKNIDKEVPSDMVMDSDKIRPQYLPPISNTPKQEMQKLTVDQTFTTYDGKTISAATLTSVPDVKETPKIYSSKLPANTELLLKSPQFGPFKGKIPAVIAEHIKADSSDISISIIDANSTQLSHVTQVNKTNDDLDAAGSSNERVEEEVESEEYEEEEAEEEEKDTRRKRDTKATQFERFKTEETTMNHLKESDNINQVDFEVKGISSRLVIDLTVFFISVIVMKLF